MGFKVTEGNKEYTLTDDGTKLTGVTDSKGEYTFSGLIPQHYVLTETATIEGHSLLKESIDITVPIEVTDEDAKNQNYDTSKAVWDENANGGKGAWCFYDATYSIGNNIQTVLPITGGVPSAVIPLLAVLLIGAAAFVIRKKKLIR